jgi:protocatechuate 3,4-dioxygenase beta subunit
MKHLSLITLFLLVYLAAISAQDTRPKSSGQFAITGRVVSSTTGEAVRGASLQLAPSMQRADMQQAESASDGSFEFHNLVPGKYALSAQAAAFPPQGYEQHGQFSTAIVVGPGKTSAGIIFRLGPDGSISGQVLDEHNEPARNAQVMLFEKSNDSGTRMIERRNQSTTNDLGQYRFGYLRPGTYYLALSAQPWYRRYMGATRSFGPGQPQPAVDPSLDTAYPVIYYPGATDPDNAGAIVLHPGDRISADFNLTPVQSLHVTIRTGSGEGGPPIQPNLRPKVFGEAWGFMPATMTWGQGQVEISGIAAGDYQLDLMRPRGRDSSARQQEISLQGDGEIDTSSAESVEGIHGVLKFEGKNTPDNAFVQLRDLGTGHTIGGRVDEQGEINLQPPHAGRYVISLGNAPGYAIRTIAATGARVSGRSVEFTGNQPVELTIDASQGVGTINGTVMNGDKPVSAAMVVLVPPNISDNLTLFRRDQSDSDGTFTLRDVVPGTYTAIAIQNGWDMEWGSPDALRPYLAKGTRVEVLGKQQLDIKIAAQ